MKQRTSELGFSLIEVAIGLVILGLAAVGIVASLSAQAEQRRYADTRAKLAQAREALLAFVSTHGRLPCPADAGSNGRALETSPTPGVIRCTRERGFLPAVTLSLPELGNNGLLLDAWNNSIGYGVTRLAAPVQDALNSPGLRAGSSAPVTRTQVRNAIVNNNQGLFVCRSRTGASNAGCGVQTNTQATEAVAVIWSAGANPPATGSLSADEQQNANGVFPRVFISREFMQICQGCNNFDDTVTWIPYSLVADRLLTAGHVQ